MKSSKLLALVLALGSLVNASATPAQPFELERFAGGTPVNLSDYTGQVVVLDFFAYWCAPCARSAPLMETEIQKYYEKKSGNAHGVPVRVISINVEEDNKKATAEFIRKNGPSLVVNDSKGGTIKSFGGTGLPFLVVLDGTKATKEHPDFEVVYAKPGFEGSGKLRLVIDALGKATP